MGARHKAGHDGLLGAADFPMAEGFGPDVELTRTQTIMQGASHCDFRYRRLKEAD